jgi:hypothetical protein
VADPRFELLDHDRGWGRVLLLRGAWYPDLRQLFADRRAEILRLSQSAGWGESTIGFVEDIPNLRGLEVYSFDVKDITPAYVHTGLLHLSLQIGSKRSIDLGRFPLLRSLFMHPGSNQSLTAISTRIAHMLLSGFAHDDLSSIPSRSSLIRLDLTSRPLKSLAGLGRFPNLSTLELQNCSSLANIADIRHCERLRVVRIHLCKSIENIEFIGHLSELEELDIDTCGEIESLRPLLACRRLRRVSFIESTKVRDGDVSCLRELPRLEEVHFMNRKHYNATRDEFRN